MTESPYWSGELTSPWTQSKSSRQVASFISQALGNLADSGRIEKPEIKRRDPDGIFDDPDQGWQQWAFQICHFKGLAEWHRQAWSWAWTIEREKSVDPLIVIAPRGSGKSTCAENIAVALGALEKRKFVLYLRASQEQANASVANIAAILESNPIARYFPSMSERSLSKFGQAKGWNRQIVRTDSDFSVLGHGLDTALRGVRLENYRPDFIILDDIDEISDSPLATQRKVALITKSILPAGSPDAVVLGVQNLVIKDGVFARLAKPQPEFLTRRKLIGPIPAVKDLEYEIDDDGIPYIVKGEATWPAGQSLETCALQMADWGVSAFLNEAQHDLDGAADGLFIEIDFDAIEIEPEEVPPLIYVVCAVDPAVTSNKRSHAQAIQIDGVGLDDSGRERIYRLYSWEGIESPDTMLRRAIKKSCELGAKEILIEVNQGGDLWQSTFLSAARELFDEGEIAYIPKFIEVRATSSLGDKETRASSMLSDYERKLFRHVAGQTNMLKKSLKRFPKVLPDDLADASYWGWRECRKHIKRGGEQKAGRIPAAALMGRGEERKTAALTLRNRFGGRLRLGRR